MASVANWASSCLACLGAGRIRVAATRRLVLNTGECGATVSEPAALDDSRNESRYPGQ